MSALEEEIKLALYSFKKRVGREASIREAAKIKKNVLKSFCPYCGHSFKDNRYKHMTCGLE